MFWTQPCIRLSAPEQSFQGSEDSKYTNVYYTQYLCCPGSEKILELNSQDVGISRFIVMFTVAQKDVAAEGQEICAFKSTLECLITTHVRSLLREELFQGAVSLENCMTCDPTQSQLSSPHPAHPKELRVPIAEVTLPCFETCPLPLTNTSRTLDMAQALRQSVRSFPSNLCAGRPKAPEALSGTRARGGQGSSGWGWKEQQDTAQAAQI